MKEYINLIASKQRKAIAMVELIFSIVVIGITLLAVPLMVNQASESTYTTLQQEGIAAAASDMSLILSKQWDEVDSNDSIDAIILTTASTNYTQAARTNLRSRTYYTSTGDTLAASGIASENSFNDIDDFHNNTRTLVGLGGDDLVDKNMSITSTVSYLSDGTPSPIGTAAGGTSNIKGITIILSEGASVPGELDKTIKLNAFSANIGSYKLERKEFP